MVVQVFLFWKKKKASKKLGMLSVAYCINHFTFWSENEGVIPGNSVPVEGGLAQAFLNREMNKWHSRSDYKYSLSSFGIHDFY